MYNKMEKEPQRIGAMENRLEILESVSKRTHGKV
jgi:hypothetical protein